MQYFFILLVVVLLTYIIYDKLLAKIEERKAKATIKLPYRVANSVLTNSEMKFYNVLKLCIGDNAVICPKVGLKDIFFLDKDIGRDYLKSFNKIAKKHIDFLLCEPNTMKPLCGIELDDTSHSKSKTIDQDMFIEKVYRDANFELICFPSKSEYACSEIESALSGILNITTQNQENKQNKDNKVVMYPKFCQK